MNRSPIAWRVRTPRLLLRSWTRGDAPALTAAIEASLEHLRAWLPWAHDEPETVEAKANRLGDFQARFAGGRDRIYGMFDRAREKVLGGIGLHRRIGEGAGEIGYWVHVDHTRQGLCTEAVAAVTRVGFQVIGLGRMEIHCDPLNTPSAAIPAKLGYRHQVTVPGCVIAPDAEPRDNMIWTMLRSEFEAGPAAAAVEVEAFDVDGDRIGLGS